MVTAQSISRELHKLADPIKAKNLAWFFKTGPGEYGEGDKFMGVVMPKIRIVAKKYYKEIDLKETGKLIQSPWHEERMTGLIILTYKYPKAKPEEQEKIYKLYFKNLKHINNWDLIDLTAFRIVGEYLKDKDKSILIKLARSKNLWEKRIAVLSTFGYIKYKDVSLSLQIAEILLHDKHDLIHKAVGWMLREIGNRCGPGTETEFLKKYYKEMPRTMLRYAIEKFPEEMRKWYLAKT